MWLTLLPLEATVQPLCVGAQWCEVQLLLGIMVVPLQPERDKVMLLLLHTVCSATHFRVAHVHAAFSRSVQRSDTFWCSRHCGVHYVTSCER